MTLMLIDDDVPMLEYVEYLLGSLGLELQLVASAFSSEDALEQFHAALPDVVIIDIGLPGMDGLELADAFRITKPEVRLIFLTCYEDFHYSKRAIQLEADDYLIKDELSPEQLKSSLSKAMSRFKSREELLERYSFRQAIERNKEVLKQSFLKQLLSGTADQENTLEFGQRLGISWKHPYLRHGFIHMDAASVTERYRYKDIPLIHFAVNNIALELSAGEASITPIMSRDADIYLVWNVAEPGCPGTGLTDFMQSVLDKVEQYLKITLWGSIQGLPCPCGTSTRCIRRLWTAAITTSIRRLLLLLSSMNRRISGRPPNGAEIRNAGCCRWRWKKGMPPGLIWQSINGRSRSPRIGCCPGW